MAPAPQMLDPLWGATSITTSLRGKRRDLTPLEDR